MKPNKHIRELAEEILQEYTSCYSEADEDYLVKMLENKFREFAREIFAEIEEVLNNIGYFDELDFNELKKKYTEGENDG